MKETRQYKQTELGLLPEDWEVVHLSDLAQNFIGLTYSPNNVKEYGTLVLRSSNIQNGKICYDNNVFVDMDIPERAKVRQNDILVCVRNGSASLIGKCAIIGELKSDTAFGAFMTILRSKDGISPNFLLYIWQSEILQQQIKNNLGATINQITNKDIDSFLVAIPPTIKEQRRIASSLTSIDNLIDSLDRLIAKKRDIKQGAMQQLLSGKKRLKGFTEPWVVKKLGEILKIRSGEFLRIEYYSTTGYKVYGGNGCIEICSCKANVHSNCLIVGRVGAQCGNVHRIKTMVWVTDNALILNANCDIDYDFLFYLFTFIGLNSLCIGNAQPLITGTSIKNLRHCFPSLPEQQSIAAVLTSMDNELSALEAKRKKYEQIKQGMMRQLLTGRIRLENASMVH